MMNQKKKLFRSRKGFRSGTESSKCRCFGRRLWLWGFARIPLGTWRWWVGTDIRWAACIGKKILFFCVERIERELTNFQRLGYRSTPSRVAINIRRLNDGRRKIKAWNPSKVYIVLVQMRPSLGTTYRQTEWLTSATQYKEDWGVPVELGKFIYKGNK